MIAGDWSEGLMPCVEKFLAEDYQRLPGQDSYDDCFTSSHFFPLQRRREMEKMIRIAREVHPRTVMEIGADKGSSLYHWCKCLPMVKNVIACEIRGTPYKDAFEAAFKHLDFLWLAASSYDPVTVGAVRGWLARDKIDVLFIDGDKGAFARDFDAYLPLMNSEGVIFMHDINDRPPREDYDVVCRRGYRHEEILDISETEESLARAKQGIAGISPHENWLRHWHGRSCGVGVIRLGGKA